MPRNKSEKPAALAPVSATTLEGMSAVVRKYDQDIQALLELVEEARKEARDWRMMWATQTTDADTVTPRLRDNPFPWEENGA